MCVCVLQDIAILEKKLNLYREQDAVQQFISTAHKLNSSVLAADAQLALLKQWKLYLEITVLRHPKKPITGDMLRELIVSTAAVLKHEQKEVYFVEMMLDQLAELLVILIRYFLTLSFCPSPSCSVFLLSSYLPPGAMCLFFVHVAYFCCLVSGQ